MDVECRIGHPSSLKKRTSSDVSMLVAELLLEKDQAVLLDLSEGLSLASSARQSACLYYRIAVRRVQYTVQLSRIAESRRSI